MGRSRVIARGKSAVEETDLMGREEREREGGRGWGERWRSMNKLLAGRDDMQIAGEMEGEREGIRGRERESGERERESSIPEQRW